MALIHVLDKQTDKIVTHLEYYEGEFSDAKVTRALNLTSMFDFTAHVGFDRILPKNRVIIEARTGGFREFIIRNTETEGHDDMLVQSDGSYIELRGMAPIMPRTIEGATPAYALEILLQGTGYEVGDVDWIDRVMTLKIEKPMDVYEAVGWVANQFGMELDFRVEIEGNRVVGRYVDLKGELAGFEGRELEYGKDIENVTRTVDGANIVTALLVMGPEPQPDDKGNVPERKIVMVQDDDALERWGRDGNHIWALYEPETEEAELTEERLTTLGRMELNKRIDALVQYEVVAEGYDDIDLGVTTRIKDVEFTPPLYLEARVHEIVEDYGPDVSEVVSYVLGDFIEYDETDLMEQIEALRALMATRVSDAKVKAELEAIEAQFEASLGLKESKIPRQAYPPSNPKVDDKWVDNSVFPNVLKTFDGKAWVKAAPTEAGEIGAETPAGAQNKADAAEGAAKGHADNVASKAESNAKVFAEQQDAAVKASAEAYARQKAAEAQNQAIIDAAADAKAKADAALAAAKTDAEAKLAAAQQALEQAIADAESGATSAAIADAEAKLAAAKKELQTAIGGKADANSVYTKTEVNTALNGKVSTTTYTADKNGIISRLDSAETSIMQNADAIKLKASQETVDGVAGRITKAETTLTQHANALTSKAEKTIVDTLTGRVDKAETSITQQAGLIASKAEKSYVDTVSGVANSAKTTAEQTAEGLKTKAEKTEVTAAVADVEKYVQSRGENLVTNGTGLLGDNTNFSSTEFDGAQQVAGFGSFKIKGAKTISSDEIIPVDPSRTYRMKFFVKSSVNSIIYAGVNMYDMDGNFMPAYDHQFYKGTVTELTQDLKPGDTYLHVSDLSKWFTTDIPFGQSGRQYSLVWWDYVSKKGFAYPPETYSRNFNHDAFTAEGMDFENNRIRLRVPWAGPVKPAGTKVSQKTYGGGSMRYLVQSAHITGGEFRQLEGEITTNLSIAHTNNSSSLLPYVAGVRLTWLINYSGASDTLTWLSGIEFSDVTDLKEIRGSVKTLSTEISQTAEAIKSKAEKSQVDTVSGVANTAKTLAEQTAEGLKSKAEKSSVDTLAGRVSTAESTIQQQADQISTKVTSTQVQQQIDVSKTKDHGYRYKSTITVYGDHDKYYPVIVAAGGDQNVKRDILVKRSYSEKHPPEWYSATHGGGLTLKIKANFGGWGGAKYSWEIHEFEEMYNPTFAMAGNTANNMAFYVQLRGGGTGGAIYHIYSDQPIEGVHQYVGETPRAIYDGGFVMDYTAPNGAVHQVKAPLPLNAPNTEEIRKRMFIKLAQENDVRITSAESAIEQNATAISQRVTQTAFDTLSGRVQTAEGKITTMAGQITAKADKTVTDGLTTRMSTAEQTLSAHDAAIKTKAEISVTNGLSSRLQTAEQTIDAQGLQIASKVAKTDYDALAGRVSTAETAITQSQREIELKVSQTNFDAFADQQMNLIPNPARTGTVDGWTTNNSTPVIETVDFLGTPTPALAINSTFNTRVYSPYFNIDSAKAYEVTLWVKSEMPNPATNHFMFGLEAEPATLEHLSAQFGNFQGNTTMFRFRQTAEPTDNAEWTKYTGYILPAGFDPAKNKGLGENIHFNARMKPTTKQIRVLWINNGNKAESPRTMWMTNAYVREVPPTLLEKGINESNVVERINLSPGLALIDFAKVKMTGELEAKHIKSLAGLNVNDQFVVDTAGNVKLSGNITGSSGVFGKVSAGEGSFTLLDDESRMEYYVAPQRNLIKDHSFELLPQDSTGFTEESIKSNTIPVRKMTISPSPWIPVGNPKVAAQFVMSHVDSLPIFGKQAAVVKSGDYLRQYVKEGVGAGSVYTVSAHFRRQTGLEAGTPRIEIWHVNGSQQRVKKITNDVGYPLPRDKTPVRHSTTFTTPDDMFQSHGLEIIVSSGNTGWVHVDGVQMVAGDKATTYLSDDGVWDILSGDYRANPWQTVLWRGSSYPRDIDTITPDKALYDCTYGWILEFSSYVFGGSAEDKRFSHFFVPKQMADTYGRTSLSIEVPWGEGKSTFKYIYIEGGGTSMTGHAFNNNTANRDTVMRRVIEW